MRLAILLLACATFQAPATTLKDVPLSELVASIPRFGESLNQTTAAGTLELLPQMAELQRRFEAGVPLVESHWRSILLDKGYLHSRAKWPSKEPWVVAFHLPAFMRMHVELVPRKKSLETLNARSTIRGCVLGIEIQHDAEDLQRVGPLPLGIQSVEFEIVVIDPPWLPSRDEATPERRISGGTVSLEVEMVNDWDAILPPADAKTMEALVRKTIRICASTACHETPRVALSFDTSDWPTEIAFSVECATLEDGNRVESVSLIRNFETSSLSRRGPYGSGFCLPFAKFPRAALKDNESKHPWSVRVRGSTRGTATMWQATQRWAGEVIIPLDEIQVHEGR